MIEEIKYNKEAKELLKKGIDILVDTVRLTLGPRGKNIIISEDGIPHVTKDGVTVVKSIQLKNPYMNIGAELIKQAAAKTVSEVGDSTTTCCILAQKLIEKGLMLPEGCNINDVKIGIDSALLYVIEYLLDNSIEISSDYIEKIATISANNDSNIGNTISNIYNKIGLEGIVRVETSEFNTTEVEVVKGMKIDKGYISPSFITDITKNTVEYNNPYICIIKGKVTILREIQHYLEKAINDNRPLVIIADEFDSTVLSSLSINNSNGIVKVCPIKSPGFGDRKGELLEDIKALTYTGNTYYIPSKMNNTIKVEEYTADKVIIDINSTFIIGGHGNEESIDFRVKELKEAQFNSKTAAEKENYSKRIANLIGGIATIYVGAATEVEMLELKDRYDDAICAVKAAIKGGISVGGGKSFINSYVHLRNVGIDINLNSSELLGFNLILDTLLEVPRQLLQNAGKDLTKDDIVKSNIGYNAKTDKWENLLDSGVIDPTLSLKAALQNAVSVATMFLTTECAIILNNEQ